MFFRFFIFVFCWCLFRYKQTNSRRGFSVESVRHATLSASLRWHQLALHSTRRTPHGASRLVQAISAWSVKIRRAPPRHCRDARIYGHTTTAIHDESTRHPIPCNIVAYPPHSATYVITPPRPLSPLRTRLPKWPCFSSSRPGCPRPLARRRSTATT